MNQLEIMYAWYKKSTINYEMLYTAMFDREVCFMRAKHNKVKEGYNMFRGFRIFKPSAINFYMNEVIRYKDIKAILNVYSSLAKYELIPDFGVKMQYRKFNMEECNWNEKHHHRIIGYDCLIDIDSPSHAETHHAKDTAILVSDLLDAYRIPYYLRFSGMGYHIVIPHFVFKHLGHHFNPHHDIETSIYKLFNDLTKALHDRFSELIDTDLHDSRRITKVPYSLVFYEDACFVSWAFNTKKEFLDHNHEDYRIWSDNLMFKGFQNCYHRGQTLFNAEKFDVDNVNELLKKLKVIQYDEKENSRG